MTSTPPELKRIATNAVMRAISTVRDNSTIVRPDDEILHLLGVSFDEQNFYRMRELLNDALEALAAADNWLDRFAKHTCRYEAGEQCTCGLSVVRTEVHAAKHKLLDEA